MTFWPGSSCTIYPILYWSWDPNWDTILSARLAFRWITHWQKRCRHDTEPGSSHCNLLGCLTNTSPRPPFQVENGHGRIFPTQHQTTIVRHDVFVWTALSFRNKDRRMFTFDIHIDSMFPGKDHSRTPGRSSRSATVGYCLGGEDLRRLKFHSWSPFLKRDGRGEMCIYIYHQCDYTSVAICNHM